MVAPPGAASLSVHDIPTPAVVLDAAAETVVEANAAARGLLRLPEEQAPALHTLLAAEDGPRFRQALLQSSPRLGLRPWRLQRLPFEEAVFVRAGQHVLADGRRLLLLLDMTAEERLTEALRESELRWGNTAENVPGALFRYVLRADGTDAVMYMSRGCVQLWEIEPASIVTDASQMWAMVHDDDRPTMHASVQASAATLSRWDHQWRITTPSGKRKWLRGIGQPHRGTDGSVVWDTLILDVTETRRAEEEREELQRQLSAAQRLEAVGRLAGGVAHDFNNLLTVMLSGVDGVLNDAALTPAIRDELRHVLGAAERAAAITRQLLTFARQQPERGSVVLDAALRGLSPTLERLAGDRIRVDLDIRNAAVAVPMSAAQLDQLLTNLVVNARHAMPDGGRVHITAGPSGEGGDVLLTVSDTGVGMPPEVRSRVFEPFFSTRRDAGGTGLGMATVHGLVLQAGGSISVESAPGEGTRFEVRLPAVDAAAPDGPSDSETLPLGNGETVLVVDDEAAVLRVTGETLRQLGYRVVPAASAEEALAQLEQHAAEVALLLTDTVMPYYGGPELVAEARRRWPSLPVLFMSGYAADGFGQSGLDASETQVLPKPFGRAALARAVHRALRG